MGALSSFAGVPEGFRYRDSNAELRRARGAGRNSHGQPERGGAGDRQPDRQRNDIAEARARLQDGGEAEQFGEPAGGIAKMASAGSSSGGIPFKIQGTTSNPSFIPDLAGMTSGVTKGLASAPSQIPGAQNLGGAVGGLFGKKKSN